MLHTSNAFFVIHTMVALSCEAKPIITQYKLKKVQDAPFIRYQREIHDKERGSYLLSLCITGLGGYKMACAVGWLSTNFELPTLWLNIGSAGHAVADIGTVYRVASLSDAHQRKTHYLSLTMPSDLPLHALSSFDEVVTQYPEKQLVDMEAMGFFHAAVQFESIEFIHVLKIVSDNATTSVQALDSKKITDIIHSQINEIDEHIEQIAKYGFSINQPKSKAIVNALAQLSLLHQTVSQQHQCRQYLQNADNLGILNEKLMTELGTYQQIPALLRYLKQTIDNATLKLAK